MRGSDTSGRPMFGGLFHVGFMSTLGQVLVIVDEINLDKFS